MAKDTDIRKLAVETDTRLAELSAQQARVEQKLSWANQQIHEAAGDKGTKDRYGARRYELTIDEALAKVEGKSDYYLDRSLAERVVLLGQRAEISDEIGELNKIWRTHQWSRFFLVTSSDGHIHKDMECMSCNWRTTYGWLPELSALTEAEAVEAYGSILCTFCYPSAPAEWTDGESKVKIAAREERAAAKAARDAKRLAKALLPDGSELRVGRERLKTLASAKAWLTDAAEWTAYSIRNGNGRHPSYSVDDTLTVAAAVAAKTGESTEEVIAAAVKRAAKRA